MKEDEFVSYSNGSRALGSNIFRYKLFSRLDCIWIDTDMFLLDHIPMNEGFAFGWEDSRYINTAVLRIPKGHDLIDQIERMLAQDVFFAPWWNSEQIETQRAAQARHEPLPLAELPWATIGPKLVTHLTKKLGLAHLAEPPETFYPVHWKDYAVPFRDGYTVENTLTKKTVGVHFWNHMLGELKFSPSAGSFIARKCHEYQIKP